MGSGPIQCPLNAHSMPTKCSTQNPTRELHLGAHSGTPLGVPLGSSTQEPTREPHSGAPSGAHSGTPLGKHASETPLGNPLGNLLGLPLGLLLGPLRAPTGCIPEAPTAAPTGAPHVPALGLPGGSHWGSTCSCIEARWRLLLGRQMPDQTHNIQK